MKQLLFLVSFLFCTLSYAEKVYLLPLQGDVNASMARLVDKAINNADSLNADYFFIELDTYGGGVHDADEIRKKILDTDIPTFIFINQNAGSAGALISIACDSIYMAPGAIMGASSVVNQTGEVVPEKYQSFMRSKMRATAEAKGRDPKIAEAMVGHNLQDSDSARVLSLTSKEAIEVGYCEGIYESKEEIFEFLNDVEFITHDSTDVEGFIMWLLQPSVQSILLLLIMGGLYYTFQTPGAVLPPTLAVLGLVLYFFPNYVYGFLELWEILLFMVGIVLILLEIFVIPGFGIAGISGIVLVILSLFLAIVNNDILDFEPVDNKVFRGAIAVMLVGIVGGFVFILASSFAFIKSPFFKKLSVQEKIDEAKPSLKELVGKTGVALTNLTPGGLVEVNQTQYDALSAYTSIKKGDSILVVGRDMRSLIVKKA